MHNLDEYWNRGSESALNNYIKGLGKQGIKTLIIIEEHESKPDWFLASEYQKHPVEVPPEELEEFVYKRRSKNVFFKEKPEEQVPLFMREYDDDGEDVQEIQAECMRISEKIALLPDNQKEYIHNSLSNIVSYVRMVERSSFMLADGVLEELRQISQLESNQDELSDSEQPF